MEKFLDCGKFTFLNAKKIIDLMILKTNANVETIKTSILNVEEKLSLLAFFAVDKISILFSRRLTTISNLWCVTTIKIYSY